MLINMNKTDGECDLWKNICMVHLSFLKLANMKLMKK